MKCGDLLRDKLLFEGTTLLVFCHVIAELQSNSSILNEYKIKFEKKTKKSYLDVFKNRRPYAPVHASLHKQYPDC